MRASAAGIIIVAAAITRTVLSDEATSCSQPLGLTTNAIEDWQLAASSRLSSDPHCAVKHARLHRRGSRAWCPAKKSKNEWLLVDLGVASDVSGVETQGRGEIDEWVSQFMVSYSLDAFKWEFARDIYGNKKVFRGNSDAHSVRHSYLEHPVKARFVRIHVVSWNNHPSLRLEIIGCQECNKVISQQPFAEFSASSYKKWRSSRIQTCSPDMADIASERGWCPRKHNGHQWLQFDLGPATLVTGMVTRGQGDRKRYVTSYTMAYSNDSATWYEYKDSNHLEAKIFGGNMDQNTERRHYLNSPVSARFVRVRPQTWHKRIGMRAAVIGCPHRGDCGVGFFRVNSGSACVPNKAFREHTWTNDKKHSWKQWRYGHSSLAVDGNADANLPNCAIMDNYYVDNPVWMVDLGKSVDANGVVVLTWQGSGQDKITSYTDYVLNLDKLTVFVSEHKLHHLGSGGPSSESDRQLHRDANCGSISRMNNALFNPRIHFECPAVKRGRYVYVKASGVEDRWRSIFSVVLCEIMVY